MKIKIRNDHLDEIEEEFEENVKIKIFSKMIIYYF